MAQTARLSPKSDAILQEMSMLTGKSNVEIIEFALENYRHQERMRTFNLGYGKLIRNKKAWKQEQNERKELEGTLIDGLEEE